MLSVFYSKFYNVPLPLIQFLITFFAELDAMTSAKSNPVISVPLGKGTTSGRNQRIPSDAMQGAPFENKMIQVPLYKGVPKSNNYNRMDQRPVMAPPVPVRVGECFLSV